MLTIALSLLFGIVAFAAIAVLAVSLVSGARRARVIVAELATIERRAHVIRLGSGRSRPALLPALAAA